MRVGKKKFWTWVFHHGDSACVVTRFSRGKDVVHEFLGDWRPEFWVSDRLGAQMGWATKEHQACLAHLIRDTQYAIDCGDSVFAPAILKLLKEATGIGQRRPDLAAATLNAYLARLESKLDTALKKTPKGETGEQLKGVDAIRMTLDGTPLAKLSEHIQAAMGWSGYHLHMFDIGGEQFGDPKSVDEVADEKRLTINGLLKSGIKRFDYLYDFGDSWELAVLIEKKIPTHGSIGLPACIDGARNSPPEDCGGTPGYEEMLEILANPKHPDYEQWAEHAGEDFDPEDFSAERADALFAARFRRKAKSVV
jgi:hypothetical protein